MRPPFDIAADLDTPVSAYLKLASFSPRFLLESVVGGEHVGRYSFIGFGDAMETRVVGNTIQHDGISTELPDGQGPLLDALRHALSKAHQPGRTLGSTLPFTGGLVGVTSYDLVRRFERLPSKAAPSPHPEAAYLATQSMLVFDHTTRRVALLHDSSDADRAELAKEVRAALSSAVPYRRRGTFGAATPTMSKSEFMDKVRRVKRHIYEGDVYQLVLSIGFCGETNLDPFTTYRALRLLNPSPYMTFCDFGDLQVIGSSPEALVKVRGNQATLRPIAGTRPRGATVSDDLRLERELLADPKEASEHVMLVDLARNDLGRVAQPGTVAVDPYRIIERYSHVMHIVSGVNGTVMPDKDPFDLFAATFPAGTVVGAPKVRAMEIIEELEPVRRGIYAGTLGYFGHGNTMDQAIAIRTMVLQNGQYTLQAGAGIVADSDPEKEHDEVMAKSQALRAALGLAQEGL